MPVNNANINGPQQAFDGDGVTTVFQYDFDGDLSLVSTIRVHQYDDVNADPIQLTEGEDYTVNAQSQTVTFVVAPASGVVIVVSRFTLRDRQIDYQSGSNLIERDLDEDTNRLTAVTQEIEGDLNNCLHLNAAGTAWNAEGLEGTNAAPATEPDSWVTYAQAVSLFSGSPTVEITASPPIVHTGDGVTTMFALTGYRQVEPTQMFVWVESVYQSLKPLDETYDVLEEDDTGYPGSPSGPAYIRFDVAPPNGAKIEIRILRGVVVGVFGDGSVDGDAIQDDAIDVNHLNVGAGVDKRMIVFDTAGDATARVITHEDVSDFDTGVRQNRLDQMAVPTAVVDMGIQRIKNVATATATLDAVNKTQMEGYVDTRLLAEEATVHAAMPTAVSGTFTDIAVFAFTPDEVVVSLTFDGTNDVLYHALFMGANARRCAGALFASGARAPDIILQRSDETLQCRILAVNGLTAWTQGRALAKKYGDA